MKIRNIGIVGVAAMCLWGCGATKEEAPKADAPRVAETQAVTEKAGTPAPDNAAPAAVASPEQASAAPKSEASSAEAAIKAADEKAGQGDYVAAFRAIEAAEVRLGRLPELEAAFERLYDAAPTYNAVPRQVSNDEISAVKKLNGGSTLVYKLIRDKQTYAAFKPKQSRKQSNHRSEIAAYRLCPLMRCRFDVPVNEPVWFTYRQFSGLYARIPSNPPDELREIEPVRVEEEDRVIGTQKAWIASYALFPIEMEEWWLPMFDKTKAELQAAQAVALLDDPKLLAHPNGTKFATELKTHFGSLTQYELALQLSNLLVFDFLLNNWDRYSMKRTFWGVNCQFSEGRFMSIDNGAALSQSPNSRPEKHLQSVHRFSRLTYEAIRALDHDKTLARLYPEASEVEKKRFETFWQQRERYLAHIQSLISEYSEAEVLFFD